MYTDESCWQYLIRKHVNSMPLQICQPLVSRFVITWYFFKFNHFSFLLLIIYLSLLYISNTYQISSFISALCSIPCISNIHKEIGSTLVSLKLSLCTFLNGYSQIDKALERKIKKSRDDKLLHPTITEHRTESIYVCVCGDVWSRAGRGALITERRNNTSWGQC